MLTFVGGVDRGAIGTRQAFDLGRIVQVNGTAGNGLDHRPVLVVALHAENNGTPRCAVQKILQGLPERGQGRVGNTAPGDLYAGNTLFTDHFIKDHEHLGMVDAADQEFAQQPAPREEMDQVIEQLLGLVIGGAVDDALGVDDRVEPAQGVESALLERKLAEGRSGSGGHASILSHLEVAKINVQLSYRNIASRRRRGGEVHLSHKISSFVRLRSKGKLGKIKAP